VVRLIRFDLSILDSGNNTYAYRALFVRSTVNIPKLGAESPNSVHTESDISPYLHHEATQRCHDRGRNQSLCGPVLV